MIPKIMLTHCICNELVVLLYEIYALEVHDMSSTIQIRVDDELKAKSDSLFKELGTDTTTAIRIFLSQAVANNGFPFEIKRVKNNPYESLTEEDMLKKLELSRTHAKQGLVKDADEVVGDIRGKYGL